MRTLNISTDLLIQVSEFVSQTLGLYFPQERWLDLQRGIASASREFDFKRTEDCIRWLTSSSLQKKEIEILASHLTVGETYFFREKQCFDVLEDRVLPELISRRRNSEKRLRIWSAGCCTGEEPYSLAILLHKMIPDIRDWNVTVIATDINPHFLRKARDGLYGEWSFRDTPRWVKERYFTKTKEGRHEILPHIQKMVQFSYLNLAEDVFPSLVNNTNAMDIIFCRNVLMYFHTERVKKIAGNFYRCLVHKGWFVVGASEAAHTFSEKFHTVRFQDAILYKKDMLNKTEFTGMPEPEHAPEERFIVEMPVNGETFSLPENQLTEIVMPLEQSAAHTAGSDPDIGQFKLGSDPIPQKQPVPELQEENTLHSLLEQARLKASEGKLEEALSLCGKALEMDKIHAAAYYLRAAILQEMGKQKEAMASLRQALYIDSDFILAHFLLGNLFLRLERKEESTRYFQSALRLLEKKKPEDILPESEGLTAGRFKEIIQNTYFAS